MLAIIDHNGNGKLDLDNQGNPSEPFGIYPIDQDGYPQFTDFSSNQSEINIEMIPVGFWEDFEDSVADKWISDNNNWKVIYDEPYTSSWVYDVTSSYTTTNAKK